MKAVLRNYRQAPRKVRLVADAVRGRKVTEAIKDLSFMQKKAASAIQKVIQSAIANAKETGEKTDNLIVKSITVDKGISFRRYRARARGRAAPINKDTSHIKVELGTK